MESIAILAAIAFAVNKTVSVIKALVGKPRDLNTVVTQVVVWAVGGATIFLCAAASLTEDMVIPGLDVTFASLDTASKLMLGWVLSSTGSFFFDFTKAVDNTDEASRSRLIV